MVNSQSTIFTLCSLVLGVLLLNKQHGTHYQLALERMDNTSCIAIDVHEIEQVPAGLNVQK